MVPRSSPYTVPRSHSSFVMVIFQNLCQKKKRRKRGPGKGKEGTKRPVSVSLPVWIEVHIVLLRCHASRMMCV